MKTLVNHAPRWLSDGAADSLERYEADKGILTLSDAGRLQSEHDELIRRWNEGGTFNRPPYLYKPGMPSSPHVRGDAIDTPEYRRFAQDSGEYGWVQNIADTDPVHFIWVESLDQHKNREVITVDITPDELRKLVKESVLQALYAPNNNGEPGKSFISALGKSNTDEATRIINAVSHNVGDKLDKEVIPKL